MYEVFFFANGNTAVCTANAQVPELQTSWFRLFVKSLEDAGVPDIEKIKFNMPDGSVARIIKYEEGFWNWRIEKR